MQALRLYAGPAALRHVQAHGLSASHVGTIPGAAGGPKGLILGPLDRFLFGEWLRDGTHPLHLVGASIGAWRMATACLNDAGAGFQRLEHDYIRQEFELEPGRSRPRPQAVSADFERNLRSFYDGHVDEVLQHPRYHLHIVTARGRHLLRREHGLRTPLGYLGAFLSNGVHRKALGAWLERVVFSTSGATLPFGAADFRTRQVGLSAENFHAALQASCSIPFVLRAIHNIPGAPPGAYWDGGITDYHLHLDYPAAQQASAPPIGSDPMSGLVLYPHFQRAVVPGWLDKGLRWRHKATGFLDTMLLLAPDPEWVKTLPNGKLPDRNDFLHYGRDTAARVKAWSTAASASRQLADEFAEWLRRPDPSRILPL